MNIYERAIGLATTPEYSRWICPLLLLAEVFLCALIVWKIPYTEIDWSTYMQQVSLFLSGERDYALIKGSTGPLVYPAVHVYIYSVLYRICDEGRDIAFAQVVFAILYIATLVIVMWSYRSARAPPYLFPLLVLSKRLHSVFLLRLFNDAVATFFLWAAILMMQRRQWTAGVVLWSMGVGVKMTLLLIAPAVAVIVVLGAGIIKATGLGITALLIQVLLAVPFLQENPSSYMLRAFEFTRQFLFKWTVNWRFVGEDTFTSQSFALALLAVHATILALFFVYRWIGPSNASFTQFINNAVHGKLPPTQISSSFVTTTMLTSFAIGLLCARTLHYQFFAYLSWTTPFLLWKSGFHPVLIYLLWAAQEWAWNVYPSTTLSSVTVVASISIQVLGTFWNGYRTPVSIKEKNK
ncbi:mannosyltransferase [Histoplasma ohiense]|nr:mannosyltransferase [Histoplasma ohiense (nom. inval.)]